MARHNQNYYINKTDPWNVRMFASRQLKPGDEIIAEPSLVQIPVCLADVWDPDVMLNAASEFNVSRHLEKLYDEAPEKVQEELDELFNKGEGMCDLFATNAFSNPIYLDGHSYSMLQIFKDIARCNHSCVPNANFDWDARRELGTLHALEDILKDEEIKIDYLPGAESSLMGVVDRHNLLKENYGFECDCAACGELALEDDERHHSKLRQEVLGTYREIEDSQNPEGESVAQIVVHKIDLLEWYVKKLQELEFRDGKVSDAYRRLAELHEEASDHVSDRFHRDECELCDDQSNSRARKVDHLNRALQAAHEARRIDILCSGAGHMQVTKDEKVIKRLCRKMTSNKAGYSGPVVDMTDGD